MSANLQERFAHRRTSANRLRALAAVSCAGVMLAGCGGFDEVRLEGGIFEAMGVAGNVLEGKQKDTKVPARSGIVMPPDTTRLPPPGSGSVAALPPGTYWPQGPEDREAAEKARLEAEHAAFCKREMLRARALNPGNPEVQGPLGSCNPGLIDKVFGQGSSQQSSSQQQGTTQQRTAQ